MKLAIVDCEMKSRGLYVVSLQYGDKNIVEQVIVVEGVVPYLQFSESFQDILHQNVGSARNLNQCMFKIHRQEPTAFPIEIGEF